MVLKIAILGAGINGLSCAVKIKEKYSHLDVVVISDEFTPNTTGDGSGGLWYPYLCGNTPESQLSAWGGETYKLYHELWLQGGHNVSLVPMYALYRAPEEQRRPQWTDDVFGYEILDDKQLEYLSNLYSVKYVSGHTFSSFVVQSPKILGYLLNRFKNANGRVVRAKVSSLREPILAEYQVVVNCTGLGARYIVPDEKVFPIRGQIFRVHAPWMNMMVMDQSSGHYIIPNAETCVLGGTHQENDFNTHIEKADTDFILNECRTIVPAFNHAKIVSAWVGFRPGRDAVRLEAEKMADKIVIHNYGHGGSGLTLFWGCGDDVLKILDENISGLNKCKL